MLYLGRLGLEAGQIGTSNIPSRLIIFAICGLTFMTGDRMPGHIFACFYGIYI